MDASPFARLPAELRIQIWRYALLQPNLIKVDELYDSLCVMRWARMHSSTGNISKLLQRDNFQEVARTQILAALSVCRVLRDETLPIFFGVNSFLVRGKDVVQLENGLREFMRTIGSKNADALRYMILDIGDLSLATMEKALHSISLLERFLTWVATDVKGRMEWKHCGFRGVATFVLRFHPSWRTVFTFDLDFEDVEASWDGNMERMRGMFGEHLPGYWGKILPLFESSREKLRVVMDG